MTEVSLAPGAAEGEVDRRIVIALRIVDAGIHIEPPGDEVAKAQPLRYRSRGTAEADVLAPGAVGSEHADQRPARRDVPAQLASRTPELRSAAGRRERRACRRGATGSTARRRALRKNAMALPSRRVPDEVASCNAPRQDLYHGWANHLVGSFNMDPRSAPLNTENGPGHRQRVHGDSVVGSRSIRATQRRPIASLWPRMAACAWRMARARL